MKKLHIYSMDPNTYSESIELINSLIKVTKSNSMKKQYKRFNKLNKLCKFSLLELNIIKMNKDESLNSISVISDKKYNRNRVIAKVLYALGVQDYSFSSSICGLTTAGFGRCDEYGYFEYPLTVDQVSYSIL